MKYRVEWKHNGSWRMDDANWPGMLATRHLDYLKAQDATKELRTKHLETRIVEEDIH